MKHTTIFTAIFLSIFLQFNAENSIINSKGGLVGSDIESINSKNSNKTNENEKKKIQDVKKIQNEISNNRAIEYLRAIYENFNAENSMIDFPLINTVRHLPSFKTEFNNKTYFLFNLSSIGTHEILKKADLVVNKKRIFRKLTFNLFFNLMKSGSNQTIDSVIKNSIKQPLLRLEVKNILGRKQKADSNYPFKDEYQWQSISIFDTLSSFVLMKNYEAQNPQNLILAIELEKYDFNRNSVKLLSKLKNKFENMINNPYLIVHSYENETFSRRFFEERILPSRAALVEDQQKDISELENFESEVDDSNTQSHDEINEANFAEIDDTLKSSSISNVIANKEEKTRKIQMLKNENEIYYNYLPQTSSSEQIKFNIRSKRFGESEAEEVANKTSEESSETFSSSQFKWPNKVSEQKSSLCRAVPITIDFGDLSFADWIIEPKSFQSNYCSGKCSLNEDLPFSNYASIQHVLNSVGVIGKNVPPPLCCAPTQTKPLTIFYLDENQHDHVVKLLPDMIVSKCSCR